MDHGLGPQHSDFVEAHIAIAGAPPSPPRTQPSMSLSGNGYAPTQSTTPNRYKKLNWVNAAPQNFSPEDASIIGKKRRRRTSQFEQEVLEAHFAKNPLPNAQTRDKLAKETGMTARSVQVWFQNKRQALKKKAQQMQDRTKRIAEEHMAAMARGQLIPGAPLPIGFVPRIPGDESLDLAAIALVDLSQSQYLPSGSSSKSGSVDGMDDDDGSNSDDDSSSDNGESDSKQREKEPALKIEEGEEPVAVAVRTTSKNGAKDAGSSSSSSRSAISSSKSSTTSGIPPSPVASEAQTDPKNSAKGSSALSTSATKPNSISSQPASSSATTAPMSTD